MDERGKLKFPDVEIITKSERLRDLKKHWESFAKAEQDEREQYLRSLEVQFSMNSVVENKETAEANNFMTEMFAEKKADERELSVIQQMSERNEYKKRSTDK